MQRGWLPGKVRYFEGKATAPAVTDDQNSGYMVSDIWIDETGDKSYQCVDATAGAAVWIELATSEAQIDFKTAAVLGTL
jgi:hypothetical protein